MKNRKNNRIQYKRTRERERESEEERESERKCREMRGLNSPVLIGRGRKGKPEKSTAGLSDFTPASSSTTTTDCHCSQTQTLTDTTWPCVKASIPCVLTISLLLSGWTPIRPRLPPISPLRHPPRCLATRRETCCRTWTIQTIWIRRRRHQTGFAMP